MLMREVGVISRDWLAGVIRDWIHEQPGLTLCGAGADTCPDWAKAYELADKIIVAEFLEGVR